METETFEDGETQTSSKHEVWDNEIYDFYKTTVKSLQKKKFQLKTIKFMLGWIPHFYKEYLIWKKYG